MRLYVKMLAEGLLEIEWDPTTGRYGICEAIRVLEPTWSYSRMEPFLLQENACWSDLEEDDMIGLFLITEQYVKIVPCESTSYYFLHVSSDPEFTFPHTRTIMFEHEIHPRTGGDKFSCALPSLHRFSAITELIVLWSEITDSYKKQVIELANNAWREHRKERADDRFHKVLSVEH
jgi:hypothetical protein